MSLHVDANGDPIPTAGEPPRPRPPLDPTSAAAYEWAPWPTPTTDPFDESDHEETA